jgi:uncharacterized protein YjbI with pentapeptide repeats
MQQREIDLLLNSHELWITSYGKQGKQLWLEDADVSGLDLSGRLLVESQLPGVNLDGVNLADSNLGGARLYGASMRHANLRHAHLGKADLRNVQADHSQFVEANLLRCMLYDADLRAASFDRALLTATDFVRADLRGCTMRFAVLEIVARAGAILGSGDATGATGTIMAENAFWETDGQRVVVDPDQLIAALRAAGAGEISAIAPSI